MTTSAAQPDPTETSRLESPPEDSHAIRVRGLERSYRRKRVLEELDLEVETGSVYALLGRNGVGKSTLSRCLLGLIPYDDGEVEVLGRDPWSDRKELMHDVAFALETPNVPSGLRIADLLRLNERTRRQFDARSCTEKLDSWQIDRKSSFGSLSRGQQTRLCLQIALAQQPQLLILDDPTIGLDPLARREVYSDLVEALAVDQLTILLTSHDTVAIESLATHVGLLQRGRLTVNESLEQLKGRFRRIRSARAINHWPAGAPRPYPLYSEEQHGWGCEWITGGFSDHLELPEELAVDEMSLEEIFGALHSSPVDPTSLSQPPASHVA